MNFVVERRHAEETDTRNFSPVTLLVFPRALTRSLLLRRVPLPWIRL